jgi:N-acetylglucosaminyl-diphospho-decaprenol L-rhamnosyltransferase
MKLSIIIVNWNSTDFLLSCLDSVYSRAAGIDFEVIVVDNASTDGGAGRIRSRFPEVKMIENFKNAGFGAANNLGAQSARGGYLLFLNPDTIVLGKAIQSLARLMDGLPDAGAIGCRLLNADKTVQTSAILRFPTILNQALGIELLRTAFPRLAFFGTAPLFRDPGVPVPVEALSGACMFVRREAFAAAGGFDERYFMYSEDVDLCREIRNKGYKVYYTGEAEIVHFGGTSTSQSETKAFNVLMMKESTHLFLEKWKGKRYAALYKAAFSLVALVRLALLALSLPAASLLGKGKKVLRSVSKWKNVLAWSVSTPAITESIGRYRSNAT